jgi:hypothetical protein
MRHLILTTVLFSVLPIFCNGQKHQKKIVSDFPGITFYLEVAGASQGYTLNVDKVITRVAENWNISARLGYAQYKRLQGEVAFRSIPFGLNIFTGGKKHHAEFGINISYVKGALADVYSFGKPRFSEGIYLTPTIGYRYQKKDGWLFLKAQYSPYIQIRDDSDDIVYKQLQGKWQQFIGLSLGYYFHHPLRF